MFAEVTEKILRSGLSLGCGDASSALVKMNADEVGSLDFTPVFRPTFSPDRNSNLTVSDAAMVMLNGLADWAIEKKNTVQCRIALGDHPHEVDTGTIIHVPAHTEAHWLRTWLATHRAVGTLEVRIRQSAGSEAGHSGSVNVIEVPFDPNYSGGRYPTEYQFVELELPPSPHAYSIEFSVRYEARTGNKSDGAPFFFIADPHVLSNRQERKNQSANQWESSASFDEGLLWCVSDVPCLLQPQAQLALQSGKRRMVLFEGKDIKVELVADHSHSVVLRSSEPGFFQIKINGKHAFSHHLDQGDVPIRLPVEYLTGGISRLSVWDDAGTQEFFSTFISTPRALTPIDVLHAESSAPFPGALMPQAAHRYQALKDQMAQVSDPETLAQLPYALSVLEGGHDNVKLKPLHFPKVDQPDVSIVIPAHNKVEVTYLGLCSLLLAYNKSSFEVIVVDDASTDETSELEDIVSGITVLHNEQPQRFIRACNRGVSEARGRFVVLLNNDVEVTSGWLDELVDAFDRFDNVGLVGSKLLYPDGRLQDAGGIVWGSGNPWNYGNRQNPWEPRFCYARQADYLSGAALMTTRDIWDQIDGLSAYLEPMYFEDTDLSFKVRDAGYTTWFVPSSIVYHYEGMTSGTDTSSGFKRYQEVNRPKFRRKWVSAYSGGRPDGQDVDLEKDRGIVGRVLFIDAMLPRPDRDAGSYAAIQEIKLVQSLGYKVTFLPSNLAHLGHYTDELEKMGVEVIYAPFASSVREFIESRGPEFDAFYITRYYVAKGCLDQIARVAPGKKVLFNNADLHFLRELRLARTANDPEKLADARKTRVMELDIMQRVDVVLSYTETEHAVIESHTEGRATVMHCPWVVEVPENIPGVEARTGLSFVGNFKHAPNAEGMEWFCRNVMPLLEHPEPDLRFHIYGSGMTDEIKALRTDTILPEGFVQDISDAYDQHRIFLAPLLSGAGIKGKVLAALSRGIPTVMSAIAAEGIGVRNGLDCLIAETPQEWADAILRLQRDDDLWQGISDHARTYVRDRYSFEKGRALMRAAFEQVELFSPRL